jgi:PPOX class probable F420-dependent enzyme
MDVAAALDFVREHHRGVLATMRRDGRPQMSPIAASVDADGLVAISSRETAIKVKNLRRDPRASLCVQRRVLRHWVQLDGRRDPVVARRDGALVEYYRSRPASTRWDDYRAAMERQRLLIRIRSSGRAQISRVGH